MVGAYGSVTEELLKGLDRGMKSDIEKCAMLVMKSGKGYLMEGVELPNQVVIRTFGEKETSKYLGILEANKKLKKKLQKSISEEPENYSR